ncbi:MAG: lactonase family protein [Oscillospiraceae bacterium]|jgi:hypothetical protein|nr:lactonase family protein [Oscillospiraceae bacterium]
MQGRVLVSDAADGLLTSHALIDLTEIDRVQMQGRPGYIYTRNGCVYIADGAAIARLRGDTLQPDFEYAAGEDIERILISHDGSRLWALLGGADTLLMMDAYSGEWLMSAPVGSHPRDLRLDRSGRYLIAAGGDTGTVVVLEADTLIKQAEYAVDGPAVGAFFAIDGVVILSETGDYEPFAQVGVYTKTGEFERLFLLPGIPTCFSMAMNGLIVGHLNAMTMLNLQHREVRWRINVQGLPDLITPAGRLACYMDRLTGRLGVIDCFQPTLMTVLRKPDPTGIAYLI